MNPVPQTLPEVYSPVSGISDSDTRIIGRPFGGFGRIGGFGRPFGGFGFGRPFFGAPFLGGLAGGLLAGTLFAPYAYGYPYPYPYPYYPYYGGYYY